MANRLPAMQHGNMQRHFVETNPGLGNDVQPGTLPSPPSPPSHHCTNRLCSMPIPPNTLPCRHSAHSTSCTCPRFFSITTPFSIYMKFRFIPPRNATFPMPLMPRSSASPSASSHLLVRVRRHRMLCQCFSYPPHVLFFLSLGFPQQAHFY